MNRDEPKSEREILRRAIEAISKRLPTGWLLEEQYDVVGANDLRADAALAIHIIDNKRNMMINDWFIKHKDIITPQIPHTFHSKAL